MCSYKCKLGTFNSCDCHQQSSSSLDSHCQLISTGLLVQEIKRKGKKHTGHKISTSSVIPELKHQVLIWYCTVN